LPGTRFARGVDDLDARMLGAQTQDFASAVPRNTDNADTLSPGHSG
jgi:hypothetical protein